MSRPRFICDAMLGRLSTWLRILGYDCAFTPEIEDVDIIARAKKEGRILLTRDRALLKRRALRSLTHLLIEHDGFRDQLVQVIREFSLDRSGVGCRCNRCNVPVEQVSPASVKRIVPFFVAKTEKHFSRCPLCHRVYWAATHRKKMEIEIDRLFEKAVNDGSDQGSN